MDKAISCWCLNAWNGVLLWRLLNECRLLQLASLLWAVMLSKVSCVGNFRNLINDLVGLWFRVSMRLEVSHYTPCSNFFIFVNICWVVKLFLFLRLFTFFKLISIDFGWFFILRAWLNLINLGLLHWFCILGLGFSSTWISGLLLSFLFWRKGLDFYRLLRFLLSLHNNARDCLSSIYAFKHWIEARVRLLDRLLCNFWILFWLFRVLL